MIRKELSFRLWPLYVRLVIGFQVYPANGRGWLEMIRAHLPARYP